MRKLLISIALGAILPLAAAAQGKSLHQLQQEFVDLRFGMFVHFGLPTFQNADWTDPDLDPGVFNPVRLDTRQWVETARSAGCTFICVSVKHHAGFCMWDTATTDYSVMNTPLGRDVLKELTTALQEAGMQVMFHFSILDTHHRIRHTLPFTREKTEFIKAQLRELLTGYGPVNTIMFDGWDAPWGRISYEDVSFPEIYAFVKSLQPDCLVMDLNGSKYPQEALFYSDIRCYEQGAGQRISARDNRLPAMACYPLQRTWFWKTSFPTDELKDVEQIVNENIIPYNNAYCTYILNAAPNRDGLIDPNAVEAMRHIGRIWKNTGHLVDVPEAPAPVIGINLAVDRSCDSSWSEDMNLMDFANDDNFSSCWVSSPEVEEPWWRVDLDKGTPVGMVVVTAGRDCKLNGYTVEVLQDETWTPVIRQEASGRNRVHISRFPSVPADAVRVRFTAFEGLLSIAEIGVYHGQDKGFRPVNPNATKEACELLDFLYSISGKYTLAGEHNFSSDLERYDAEVLAITGKLPVIWGSDFSFNDIGEGFERYQHAGPLNVTVPFERPCIQTGRTVAEARQDIVDTAIRKWAEGRIITLMWHCCDPRFTDGNDCNGDKVWTMENGPSAEEWDALCTPGTPLHAAWEREMDTVIPYLLQLQEAGVPVLWRPYHEMNGAWFWWGNQPGEQGFKRLWIMTYEYFTGKGLNNLLWVWDPNAPRVKENDDAFPYADFYPGNEYVDVLAADIYGWDYKQSHHDELVELGGGRPVAMGEIGQLPKELSVFEEQPAWTWFMVWGYFIGGHRAGDEHLDLVRRIYDSPRILTLDEIVFEDGKHRVRE